MNLHFEVVSIDYQTLKQSSVAIQCVIYLLLK